MGHNLYTCGSSSNVHVSCVYSLVLMMMTLCCSCRYGAAELHSVAAYMGGVAAQEVIKVITHQFIPINNTYIYNAMKQSSITVKM